MILVFIHLVLLGLAVLIALPVLYFARGSNKKFNSTLTVRDLELKDALFNK